MQPSQLLRTKIRLVSARLEGLTSSLWLHPDLRACLPEVLLVLHDVARASVPLMAVTLAEARERAGDQVALGLAAYLERHIPEEEGHDTWFVEDLEVLGVDRSTVARRIARPSVARLIGAQHYWVRHAHPAALLGYLAVLEGSPPTAEGLAGIQERTGVPSAALRTWLLHARLDPGHKADIDALIDALPMTAEQTSLVATSALHTVGALETMVQELLDLAGKPA